MNYDLMCCTCEDKIYTFILAEEESIAEEIVTGIFSKALQSSFQKSSTPVEVSFRIALPINNTMLQNALQNKFEMLMKLKWGYFPAKDKILIKVSILKCKIMKLKLSIF
mmetsp:Transcript_420/g.548  ORF Transcript_420/g.548 Transcript_420/m.548 type:complete len:109 (+) Transcript_420:337-663(+)